MNLLYHILHAPTAWSHLHDMYDNLSKGRIPTRTRLAFAFGIFSAIAYLDRHYKEPDFMALNASPRILSEKWFRHAVFLLMEPPVSLSTEALQAQVIIAQLSVEFGGFSNRFHYLWLSTIRIAQKMKIHRLDSPYDWEERKRNGVDLVDIETRRRLWWHIVSSDWYVNKYLELFH